MSKSNNEWLVRHLMGLFEKRLGFSLSSISDCHRASVVLSQNRVALSGYTIARVFGILKSQSKPYKSTLNIIAQFSGFIDLDHYLTSIGLVRKGALEEAQILVNKNNARIEIALRFAFQTEDAATIHSLLEQVEEDPYSIWLSNLGAYLYSLAPERQLRLLEILSKSDSGIKYFYEQYVNENDVCGTYAAALNKFYRSSVTVNQSALFSQLFYYSKCVYNGMPQRLKNIDLNGLSDCAERFAMHFHLRSRIFEVEILRSDLIIRNKLQKNILHAFADRALDEAASLNTVDKTWFYSRICKAVAYKDLLIKLLEHDEFRIEIQQLHEAQKGIIHYQGLMMLQTVLHYYWNKKGIEHGYLFQLHHPFCTQNETISIKSMEAFGLALYDKSFIGASIRKNLPLTIKQNGQLWMKGLLPALN